jgi:hypothetical protein
MIRMIRSRRMRWAGHVVCMGRKGIHIGYWWEMKLYLSRKDSLERGPLSLVRVTEELLE